MPQKSPGDPQVYHFTSPQYWLHLLDKTLMKTRRCCTTQWRRFSALLLVLIPMEILKKALISQRFTLSIFSGTLWKMGGWKSHQNNTLTKSLVFLCNAFSLHRKCRQFVSKFADGHSRWPIRNCAMMTFSALMERIFKPGKTSSGRGSSLTTRAFFARFSALEPLLLSYMGQTVRRCNDGQVVSFLIGYSDGGWPKQLEEFVTLSLYPLLLLLSDLEYSPYEEYVSEFRPLITACMAMPTWKTREIAAEAFASLVSTKETAQIINKLLLTDLRSQNALHGSLIAAQHLIETKLAFSEDFQSEANNDNR